MLTIAAAKLDDTPNYVSYYSFGALTYNDITKTADLQLCAEYRGRWHVDHVVADMRWMGAAVPLVSYAFFPLTDGGGFVTGLRVIYDVTGVKDPEIVFVSLSLIVPADFSYRQNPLPNL